MIRHRHIAEFVALIEKYQTKIWPFLKKTDDAEDLNGQILVVGDYPRTNVIDKLRHYESGLKAIISVTDYGIIHRRGVGFGSKRNHDTLSVSIIVLTADPSLREEIGGYLWDFLDYNADLFHGTASRWTLQSTLSKGVIAAPDDLYARRYAVELEEITY